MKPAFLPVTIYDGSVEHQVTLEYWLDDGWYVGRVLEVAGVFSQGETLAELEENIRDAWKLMTE